MSATFAGGAVRARRWGAPFVEFCDHFAVAILLLSLQTDFRSQPVAGASVRVSIAGVNRTFTADADGLLRVPDLEPDLYMIEIADACFEVPTIADDDDEPIVLELGEPTFSDWRESSGESPEEDGDDDDDDDDGDDDGE